MLLAIALFVALVSWLPLNGCTTPGPVDQPRSDPIEMDGQIRLSWEAPSTRTDGTPLTDIAGFKLYYGPTSGAYAFMKSVGNQTTYALSGLEPGQTYYLAVTAYDSTGNESQLSAELMVTAPPTLTQSILLTQEPIRRGQPSQFRVRGANPHEVVSFLFSESGEGEGPCSQRLGGLCVDLIEPWVFGEATTDASGTATLDRTIPADAPPGQFIAIQAVIQRGQGGGASVKTNAITARVMD